MEDNKYIDKILNGGVILSISFLLYILFSYILYPVYSEGFWFASAVFILFSAEHLFNYIKRSRIKFIKNTDGSYYHRFLSCFVPAVIVVLTWLIVDGL